MSVLSREALRSGDFLEKVGIAADILWSREQIERSLLDTLLQRPAGPLWIFAYGSLMWNPLLQFDCSVPATLDGWHRSFCLDMQAGRGSADCPGRMLALEAGGRTQGLALRLHDDLIEQELRLLWNREMLTGAYRPLWTELTLANGEQGAAIAFVIDTTRPQYAADASVTTVAPMIARACGAIGTNVDYLHRLSASLAQQGIRDDYVTAIEAEIARLGNVAVAKDASVRTADPTS